MSDIIIDFSKIILPIVFEVLIISKIADIGFSYYFKLKK
jgi:hypothetical protein